MNISKILINWHLINQNLNECPLIVNNFNLSFTNSAKNRNVLVGYKYDDDFFKFRLSINRKDWVGYGLEVKQNNQFKELVIIVQYDTFSFNPEQIFLSVDKNIDEVFQSGALNHHILEKYSEHILLFLKSIKKSC